MSKLSVTFQGVPVEVIELQQGETRIGRDPSNGLRIDSLAIADFHAAIRCTPEGCFIQQLQADFPVIVNNRQVMEAMLNDGDRILIGKHSLHFSQEQPLAEVNEAQEPKPTTQFRPFEGSFQVMNGRQIGMVIPLKAAVAQIGKESSGRVIVTRGSEGYSIAAASDNVLLTINGQPVEHGDAPLVDGDIVRINSSLLQFFQR